MLEVEKILRRGKLTEKSLRQLQQNFSRVDFVRVRRDVIVKKEERKNVNDVVVLEEKASSKIPTNIQVDPSDSPEIVRRSETAFGINNAEFQPQRAAVSSTPRSGAQRASEQRPSPSKRDAWSLITLHNDLSAVEEARQAREKRAELKAQMREQLLLQMQQKQRLKQGEREALLEEAMAAQRQAEELRADEDRKARLQKERLALARQRGAEERAAAAAQHEAVVVRRLQEEKVMLSEFQRQLDEEKARRQKEVQEKNRQYQAQQEENARELERRQAAKDREREENERLFRLQLDMAEKQEVRCGW